MTASRRSQYVIWCDTPNCTEWVDWVPEWGRHREAALLVKARADAVASLGWECVRSGDFCPHQHASKKRHTNA